MKDLIVNALSGANFWSAVVVDKPKTREETSREH